MAYQYSAFISYSWDDEKWAKWLQKRLETYRLPTALQKELPEGINGKLSVFRDKTDMKQAPENPTIEGSVREKLEQSQYLIVICSERAARSKYVGKEIAIFRELGRGNRIIPFVVSGVPNDKKITEKFPPALREVLPGEEVPLAFSVMDIDRETALIKVVATLLNLKRATLEHRERQRRRRRRLSRGSAAAVLLAMMVLAAVGLYDYYVPHVKYYVRVVERWGMPVGLGEVTKAEMEGMHEHYRITEYKSEDKTVVARLNSYGDPALRVLNSGVDSVAYTEYYHPNGELNRITQRDARQNVLSIAKYTEAHPSAVLDYQDGSKINPLFVQTQSYMVTPKHDDFAASYRSGITREISTYDEKSGAVIKTLFMRSSLNEPACLSNGAYGIEMVYNEDYTTETLYFLNKDGQRAPINEGISGTKTVYENNNQVEVSNFLVVDGKETATYGASLKAFAIKMTYDDSHNMVSEGYYDASGQLTCNGEGIAYSQREYTARGDWEKESHFDETGTLTLDTKQGYAIRTFRYDNAHRPMEVALFGLQGEPVYGRDGAHITRSVFDQSGNPIEWTYYGLDGETRVNGLDGYATVRLQFDETGVYETNRTFFDDAGVPCYDTNCVHEYRYTYENGQMIHEAFYDVEGNPTYDSHQIASADWVYDALGNFIASYYYDAQGRRAYYDGKHVGYRIVHDEIGWPIQEDYFVLESEESENYKLGYSIAYEYDDKYNTTARLYKDASGQYTDAIGYAGITYTHDEIGTITSLSYMDTQGKPSMALGYATQKIFEREKNRSYMYAHYDADGQLTMLPEGYAVMLCTYNQLGYLYAITYYDDLVSPIETNPATVAYAYDEANHCIAEYYYDPNGAPYTTENGYVSILYEYDKFGREAAKTAYDAQGYITYNPEWGCMRVENTYDAKGRIIQSAYLDANGQLRSAEYGYAFVVNEYDPKGNLVRVSYLDDTQQFFSSTEYSSQTEYGYDRKNAINLYTVASFDAQGNWLDNAYGFAYGVIHFTDGGEEGSTELYTAEEMRYQGIRQNTPHYGSEND
ncbi:MAG: TIR domain-containing protein [Oscillospiraceae bacterium]|jgi:hypothetical protein|nr:TIR domain-containing protein [Oscillospiraceae bacterium]